MFGPGSRRRYSAVGATTGGQPAATPPFCSTGDAKPLYQMLTDLGLYIGPWESYINASLQQSIASFARSKGLDVSGGIDAAFCQALLEAWGVKTSPPKIDPAALRASGLRFSKVPGGGGEAAVVDPISDCHNAGGTWDHMAMVCQMPEPGLLASMSPTTKYLLIGGAVLAVAAAGYGIYAATR